jgi:hypothetical protein
MTNPNLSIAQAEDGSVSVTGTITVAFHNTALREAVAREQAAFDREVAAVADACRVHYPNETEHPRSPEILERFYAAISTQYPRLLEALHKSELAEGQFWPSPKPHVKVLDLEEDFETRI